jgi:ATP-dependent DNA helicase DinG
MATQSAVHLGSAAESIRREIRRARGNEVCFLARLSEDREIVEPRVVARGNPSAVLAAVRNPEPGGILLHNHPSGVLDPSEADLAIASQLWEIGLGFGIIDNDVEDLYVVVEPPSDEKLEPLDLHALESDLGPDGPIARLHPAYEDRPEQRAFTRMVGELYNEGGVGIAEAGTGTGKSIAYLLPAIRWAVGNRERTVVSTNTINLQEQLVDKDLPFLRRALGEPFRYTLIKGRQNYVSIRRARLAFESALDLLGDDRQAEIGKIVEWLESTRDGSLSDLSFRPSPEVWDAVASESDVCLRNRCPHFQECFYQRARREASSADVVVVNHHLLFADLAVRRSQGNYTAPAVLPHYRRLVLDEAHNLEETATKHLGSTVSRRGLFRVLRRLENRGKGVLPALVSALKRARGDLISQSVLDTIEKRLMPELNGARGRAGEVFDLLDELLADVGGSMLRVERAFAAHPVWTAGLTGSLESLLAHLDALRSGVESLRDRIIVDERARSEMEAQLLELRGIGNRLDAAAHGLRSTLQPGEESVPLVRWIERRGEGEKRERNLVLAAAPLEMGGVIRESILEKVPTVILTSATLATGGDFRFIRDRLGMLPTNPVREAVFDSPFDFPSQALLGVPTDLRHPTGEGDGHHDDATVRAAIALARLTDGGIFVLFTSYRALAFVAAALRRRSVDRKWPLLVQGEAPRSWLVQRFVESGRSILLGTTSFWEGVDVPGRPLRGLLIPRLPFKVPSEPVTAARIEAIDAAGGNSFGEYMLPHAAIRLKQGFGRLIRSRGDSGAVLILDSRIASKSYGRYLLQSLPPAAVSIGQWRQVYVALLEFYRRTGLSSDPGVELQTTTGPVP